jgi:predicted CoA-binding protein
MDPQVAKVLARVRVVVQPEPLVRVSLPPSERGPLQRRAERFHAPFCVTFTSHGVSLVCREVEWDQVGKGLRARAVERGYRMITLDVELEPEGVGYVRAVTERLAQAGVVAGLVSTFHRDHLLVREEDVDRARQVLESLVEECRAGMAQPPERLGPARGRGASEEGGVGPGSGPEEALAHVDRGALEEAREILRTARRIAVVGLSDKPHRPSHGVARYLQEQGYEIVPVNPRVKEVLGVRSYPRLVDVPAPVDVVQIFRRSEYVPEVVEEAVAVGARAVWMQLGVRHEKAAGRARAAGLRVVMDTCMATVHRLLRARGEL